MEETVEGKKSFRKTIKILDDRQEVTELSAEQQSGDALASRRSQPNFEDERCRKIRSESHVLIPREMSAVIQDLSDFDDDDKEQDKVFSTQDNLDVNMSNIISMIDDSYFEEPSVEDEEEEEEAEEEREEIEEESTLSEESDPIEREECIEHYKNLVLQFVPVKAKNLFLQRKMAEYFKRRKMEHVLRETDQITLNLAKYHKKLDLFYKLRESDSVERNRITTEISTLRTQRAEQIEQVVKDFKSIQKRERETGTGLIYTKTGRQIPEKESFTHFSKPLLKPQIRKQINTWFLERLLWHQVNKTEEITKMRMKFIRLRDAVAEKQQQILDMDKIGENHTLIDFEQLKMENQAHADKIEERDEELARLRVTCSSAIECLAHIREKCVANAQTIQESKLFLSSVTEQLFAAREKVNKIKLQRDTLRAETSKLKEESGLLTKPKLLRDMEDALSDVNVYIKELEDMKAKYEIGRNRLYILKKNVAIAKKESIISEKISEKQDGVKLYKGRPSLMIPILPKEKSVNYINI